MRRWTQKKLDSTSVVSWILPDFFELRRKFLIYFNTRNEELMQYIFVGQSDIYILMIF